MTTVEGTDPVDPRAVRSPARRRIKELGTNGGGFSTPTRPTRSRTPTGSPTSSRSGCSWSSRSSSPSPSAGWSRTGEQGLAVLAAMFALWLVGGLVAMQFEANGNPKLDRAGREPGDHAHPAGRQHGGQGDPVRSRSAAGCSPPRRPARPPARSTPPTTAITPAGGAVPLVQHDARARCRPAASVPGLYGMLVFALLAVFIAGLMVGRTPEYLGKKIQARGDEARRALHPLRAARACSASPAVSVVSDWALASLLNTGPHGLTEIVLRLHLGRQQQRLGLRWAHRQHRLVQHHARALRCWSAGSS